MKYSKDTEQRHLISQYKLDNDPDLAKKVSNLVNAMEAFFEVCDELIFQENTKLLEAVLEKNNENLDSLLAKVEERSRQLNLTEQVSRFRTSIKTLQTLLNSNLGDITRAHITSIVNKCAEEKNKAGQFLYEKAQEDAKKLLAGENVNVKDRETFKAINRMTHPK